MEAVARIRFGQTPQTLWTRLSPLQAAEIAASKYGFFDVDVDSDDNGTKITATASNRKVIARGKTMELAVEKLLNIFTGG